MADTKKLTKEERKKTKRAARKKIKAEKPKKPRDYARGSKKRKVKKLARGQGKRYAVSLGLANSSGHGPCAHARLPLGGDRQILAPSSTELPAGTGRTSASHLL